MNSISKAYDPNKVCYRLEGYLYPNTYQFYKGMKAQDAIGIMLRGADAGIDSKYSYSGMTTAQIVTLASIIQQEAPDLATMKKVSAVFHNRLKIGKPLQADSTVFYLTKKGMPQNLVDKYKIYYNTYRSTCKALPAGPICSPGSNALSAAVNPDSECIKEDDLYFASTSSGYTFSHDYMATSTPSGG